MLFEFFSFFFLFGKLYSFSPLSAMLKRRQIVSRLLNVEHIFEIWARHRLLDVPRLPREKVSERLIFRHLC